MIILIYFYLLHYLLLLLSSFLFNNIIINFIMNIINIITKLQSQRVRPKTFG